MGDAMNSDSEPGVSEMTDGNEGAESPVSVAHDAPQADVSPAAEQAAESPVSSPWAAFRSLPEFQGQDDLAIARRLYSSMEREKEATRALATYQQYVPLAQQYLQHREPFEKWLAEQEQSRKAAATQEKKSAWWSPPEVRPSYLQYLTKDESGRDVISQDAPLEARHALYELQKYRADFAQKFLSDPQQALGPMVEEIAAQRAQEIIDQRLSHADAQQYASNLEQQNRDWLYDDKGQPTQEGLAAQRYIREAGELGITSPQAKWAYAQRMVENDLMSQLIKMEAQGQPAAPAQSPQPAPQMPDAPNPASRDIDFLRREAARNPSRARAPADPRVPQEPLTFEQKLARQAHRDGLL